MSLRHIFPTARPPRVLLTLWALPTRVRHGQGCRENLLHPYHRALSPPTRKGQALRGCFASLDRFPAPSASVSFATPRRWRGVKGDEVVHFTLDALNRPNTHRRGRWIGFATCPAASQVRVGLGQSPKGLFLFLKLLVDVTVQKGQKCAFLESLLLKTPQIWPISDPTPHANRGE